MRKIFTKLTLFFITLFFIMVESQAQNSSYQQESIKSKRPIVCPAGKQSLKYYVPPPAEFLNKGVFKTESGATIVVNYSAGFNSNPEAKAAFQYAVDIWAATLTSPIQINIDANWVGLAQGVLGSASPSTFYRNFPGAAKLNTWYPVALAEKMANRDLNIPGQADLNTNFNANFDDWYFGTDGNPPFDKYDFVSVVLHELGHGLGFFSGGRYDQSADQGSMRFSGFLIVFDHYMEDNNGILLKTESTYADPSAALGNIFKSNLLYFDSPLVLNNNSNQRARLYAPIQFNPGSSVSHLDQNIYEGTINGLMSPQASPGTAEHDPGPITKAMFNEMGWVHTYIEPDTIKSTETIAANFLVKTKVFSDLGIDAASLKFFYSIDNFATTPTELALSPTGMPDEYSVTIPGVASGTTVGYYITVNSTDNRSYYAPTEATAASNYLLVHFLQIQLQNH